jgi:heterotetrameric sarcosine oxidase gamma subunit
MPERRSVLARQLARGGRDGVDGRRALVLGELRGWHLYQLSAFAGTDDALRAQLNAFGVHELPQDSRRVTFAGDARLYRLGPARYLWAASSGELMRRVARELDPAAGCLTVLSGARVRLLVEGSAAAQLLQRGIALDLHPSVFAVGHFAQTALDHVPVLLERTAELSYAVQVPTTWAVSVWEWLSDAALPFGYDVLS